MAAQAIGTGDGADAVAARPRVRRYVDDWVVWARACAKRAAEGARRAYDVLVGKLVEAGVQLNLAKTGVVSSSARGWRQREPLSGASGASGRGSSASGGPVSRRAASAGCRQGPGPGARWLAA